MFEQASRMKLRIAYKGSITSEDLWDLPLEALDEIYRGLRARQKAAEQESLLTPATGSQVLDLKVALVKRVVETKLQEAAARANRAEARQRVRRIDEVLAQKQDASLLSMSEEDLLKMREGLKA